MHIIDYFRFYCICNRIHKVKLSSAYNNYRNVFLAIFAVIQIGFSSAHAAIVFTDVSDTAGVSYKAPSFGVSWGDFNGDQWPDIWVGNHYKKPCLYLNQTDGTFKNIIDKVWSGDPEADAHGAAWADFDNDGDQDLIEQVGASFGTGKGPNHLYVNKNGVLHEMAVELGVDQPLARGRTPLWFDADLDGLLDLVLLSSKRPDGRAPSSIYHQQKNNSFIESNDKFAFHDPSRSRVDKFKDVIQNLKNLQLGIPNIIYGKKRFAVLSDLKGDGVMELISFAPMRINKVNKIPFEDITYDFKFPEVRDVKDVAIADFNGDQSMDMYITRSKDPSDITFSKNKISAHLVNNNFSSNPQIVFHATSAVKFWIGPPTTEVDKIYIGGKKNKTGQHVFELDSDDAVIKEKQVNYDTAKVVIEFNPNNKTWILKSIMKNLTVEITTTGQLKLVSVLGAVNNSGAELDTLLIQKNMKLVEKKILKNSNLKNACNSVVAEDFDNDMDIDIYLACSRTTGNLSNIYLDNQGNGKFNVVDLAGGAAGHLQGRGESVASADYDQDGFIDLFVTNGAGVTPFAHQGRHQLFRNMGNSNHWLQIDLQGVVSNFDGIGAKVILETDGKQQLREQSGGMHRNAQNYKRLHFGLGENKIVDKLTVYWPSGIVQTLKHIKTNNIISITEPVAE